MNAQKRFRRIVARVRRDRATAVSTARRSPRMSVNYRSPIVIAGFIFIPLLIIVKHHANIRRLFSGTESRFGSKKAPK